MMPRSILFLYFYPFLYICTIDIIVYPSHVEIYGTGPGYCGIFSVSAITYSRGYLCWVQDSCSESKKQQGGIMKWKVKRRRRKRERRTRKVVGGDRRDCAILQHANESPATLHIPNSLFFLSFLFFSYSFSFFLFCFISLFLRCIYM